MDLPSNGRQGDLTLTPTATPETVRLNSSHSPFLSQPARLADILTGINTPG